MMYRVEILFPNLPGRLLLGKYGSSKGAEEAIADHKRRYGEIFGYDVVSESTTKKRRLPTCRPCKISGIPARPVAFVRGNSGGGCGRVSLSLEGKTNAHARFRDPPREKSLGELGNDSSNTRRRRQPRPH